MNWSSENHLTAALFENFVVLEETNWLERLMGLARLPSCSFLECRWGYEVLDRSTSRMADIAIHARSAEGDCVIVIEAKRKSGKLKKSDTDPSSYLELREFSWAKHRYLIYLLDDQDVRRTTKLIVDPLLRSGFLTWQQLGGLQIELALELDCAPQLRAFIAGAIQHQYLNHGIRPTRLIAEYLASEPSRDQINKTNPEKMKSWATEWRLP